MSDRPVVYTALMGSYEALNEQPVAARSELDFVCFTDDPSLRSDSWRIEVIEPAFPLDPVRSARRIKILGEPLSEVSQTLWIDNSVVLTTPPEELLGDWLAGADLVVPRHSFRDHLREEFAAVLEDELDAPDRVNEQLNHYLHAVPDVLEQQPLWTAILVRRRTDAVVRFATTWFEHVLRYSRRDQLSAPVAVDAVPGLRLSTLAIDNYATSWHRWPVTAERRRHDRPRDPLAGLRPLADRVEALEDELEQVSGALLTAEAERGAAREAVGDLITSVTAREHRLVELDQQVDDLHRTLGDLRTHAEALEAELRAARASMTWRVGSALLRPIRAVAGVVRRSSDS